MKRRDALDAMTDLMLRHQPKPKTEPARKRQRKQRQIQRGKSSM